MRSHSGPRIAFLIPYPLGVVPGQRFRFEQYHEILIEKGYQLTYYPFLDMRSQSILYRKGHLIRKTMGVIKGFVRRIYHVFKIRSSDYVFLYREVTPIGPPVFEYVITKILRRRVIYDFDDAIWLPNTSKENAWISTFKWAGKVHRICRWSFRISTGNSFLADFARRYNREVIVNPTTIDTINHHNPNLYSFPTKGNSIYIGWTGSHSTIPFLSSIESCLQEIERRFADVQFVFIADRAPSLNLKRSKFIRWNKQSEISDLLTFDIGIMPIPQNDDWAKGKCGFKILQYFALEIPAVATPVGVNAEIIVDGKSGFLATNDEEWVNALSKLVEDTSLRKRLGMEGRKLVQERYSVVSNTGNFLSLFEY